MITIQDLCDILDNKISNQVRKSIIRNNFPPQIAEQICDAIDRNERAEHLVRFFKECMEFQQKQQQTIQAFLQQYYNR